jgi:hypothetical protein
MWPSLWTLGEDLMKVGHIGSAALAKTSGQISRFMWGNRHFYWGWEHGELGERRQMMTTKAGGGIGMAVALSVLLGLVLAAGLALGAEASLEPTASCLGTGPLTIIGQATTQRSVVPGVTITLTQFPAGGCTDTTTTNSNGTYAFRRLAEGLYVMAANKTGCTFRSLPEKQLGSKVLIVNFTGDCPQ